VDKANVYQMVEAGGVYAGLSLQGYVISARDKHNLAYYGRPRTPREIVVDRLAQRQDADVLRGALTARPAQSAN
jgi:SH3 domain-containing YSC84-like protein 1